ncbi:MAG: NYN domain-containing protein [Nostoc sp. TH1S01]|nr:NYN domain-containing protein [Nostoc sp. TH1S01]
MRYHQLISNLQINEKQPLVSFYWDYQNALLALDKAKLLLEFAYSVGNVINKNVYYNSQKKDQSILKHEIENLGFHYLDVPCSLKNSADNQLIADCLDDINNDQFNLDIVILVSGDGDFIKLVRNLQKLGKKVIILAQRGNVKQKLKELADEFYFIDDLSDFYQSQNHASQIKIESKIDYNQAIDYLIEAIRTAISEGQSTTFSIIDKLMRQRCSNYQGFASILMPNGKKLKNFSQFVNFAVNDGKVQNHGQELFLVDVKCMVV